MSSPFRVSAALFTVVVLGLLPGIAASQTYPTKPIRYVVPNSPGAGPDLVARIMGPEMAKVLGQQFIVENRPSATSVVGYEYVAKQSAADGYTIASTFVSELATMPLTVKELRFDPFNDLVPVIGFGEGRVVVGSSASRPWRNIDELVVRAKANPGKLNYGASAPSVRLPMEALVRALGLDIVSVPYSSGAQYLQAAVSGEVDLGFVADTFAISWGDKFRVLAVSGERRLAALPDSPTFLDLGLPNIPSRTFAISVPAGTPKGIIERLHAAASQALQQPQVKASFAKIQLAMAEKPGPAVTKHLLEVSRIFTDVAKKAGIKPE